MAYDQVHLDRVRRDQREIDLIEELNSTRWDDLRFPLMGERLDTTTGRLSYDYTECTVDFAANARYTNEPICMVAQLPHAWLEESEIRPHLHWIQQEANDPNWLLGYRVTDNGDAPGAFTFAAPTTARVFTYSSGDLQQITKWDAISMTGKSISCIVDLRFYRDSNNTSTLFAGSDPYTPTAKTKELDIHFQIDSRGSEQEFTK